LRESADVFNDYRSLLFSIAYRMLGSVMEAEDIVQEAYLRWQRAAPDDVESPKAYLSAVVTRLCIDQLRSAQSQRETYLGPWLPEPLMTEPEDNPANAVTLSESLSMAFLVLLEQLSPDERAAFLLREVFDYPYSDIAQILGKSEAACRQLITRARQHISEGRPRFEVTPEEQQRITMQFVQSLMTGDLESLMAVVAPNAVMLSDGGGKATAATRPVVGPEKIGKFFIGLWNKRPDTYTGRLGIVNGRPALLGYVDGKPFYVMVLEIGNGQIQAIHNVLNPDKLTHIPPLDS
jgi:RNA polymerase sigma-70 factor, ECF subfamily